MVQVRPRIAVFFLGGTIAMVPDKSQRIKPELPGEQLLQSIGRIDHLADVEVTNFSMLPSSELTLEHLRVLATTINGMEDVDGFVVVQGTDTIEETSFALGCLVTRDVPLVITGAMRGPLELGADGSANLRAAIMSAIDPRLADLGASVVMNNEIHAATYVQKSHTFFASAFNSPNAGPMGFVIEGKAHLVALPAVRSPRFEIETDIPSVALIKVGMGDDGRLLSAVAQSGFKGVVLEGLGVGHVPTPLLEHIDVLLASRIPVVLARRDSAGCIFSQTYGYPGSESDLLNRGVINSGLMGGLKARLFLQIILASGDQNNIQQHFSVFNTT